MMMEFSGGKIIATAHEVVVRLLGEHSISLQSSSDNVTLLGKRRECTVSQQWWCKMVG